MTSITDSAHGKDPVAEATELVGLLRRNAREGEELRRLPAATLDALVDAGLTRLRTPAEHGGSECDMTTVLDTIATLARGDGATGWTASVWAISSFVVGMFPDEVQDKVFADPQVRVSGILSPSAMGTPVEGGIRLTGRWTFNTGAGQSQWNTSAAVMPTPDGELAPIMTLIPTSEMQIVDDWHTSGLRASGSVTTVVEDLFVPEERVLPLGPALMAGIHRSRRNATTPLYRVPFLPIAATTAGATALGLAQAALELFLERLPGRKITYTDYASQAEAPVTHLQVAEAVALVDEADFHLRRVATTIDRKATAGEPWTVEERGRARLHVGAACRRAKEAVDLLAAASGGSSIYEEVPIQRIVRDVQAFGQHAIMAPAANFELYGRIACGLGPNTQYL